MRRLGAIAVGAAALGGGVGASASARADLIGTIALAPDKAPVAPEVLTRALELAAAGAGDRVVVDPIARARAAIVAGAVPAGELARFRRVAELAAEGWRAYLQVAADFAAARLGAAREGAEALLAWDGGPELYADVSLRLGAVLDALGRPGPAAEAFRIAAALDPTRAVTTAEFSPDVVAAFDAARAATPIRAPMTITSEPGATLEVDGRALGPAPARLALALGTHVVVARGPGHRPRGLAFAVAEAGGAIEVPLDDDGAPASLAIGAPPDRALGMLDAALVYGEVDGVVLAAATWRQGQPVLLGQWCSGAPIRCTPVIEVSYASGELDAAATRVWRALREARTAARYPPTLPTDDRLRARSGGDERCRLCRNPWLWAGVGAAVIAAGVTTAVVVGGGAGQPVVTIDTGKF